MSLDIYLMETKPTEVFWAKITHNLRRMWLESDCYTALYNSEGKMASDVLPKLQSALKMMLADPAKFEAMNPENGWGDYRSAVEFLTNVVDAFKSNPDAIIQVSA